MTEVTHDRSGGDTMTNMNSNARVARPIMSRENGSRIPYPVSWTRYPVSWSRYHPTPTPYHPTAGILWGYKRPRKRVRFKQTL